MGGTEGLQRGYRWGETKIFGFFVGSSSIFNLRTCSHQLTRHTIDTLNMREDVRGVLMTEEFKI